MRNIPPSPHSLLSTIVTPPIYRVIEYPNVEKQKLFQHDLKGVGPKTTIGSLKDMITKDVKFPRKTQRLYYGGTQLSDELKTLEDYGISRKTTILIITNDKHIAVFSFFAFLWSKTFDPRGTFFFVNHRRVKREKKRVGTVHVSPDGTIRDLKEMMELILGETANNTLLWGKFEKGALEKNKKENKEETKEENIMPTPVEAQEPETIEMEDERHLKDYLIKDGTVVYLTSGKLRGSFFSPFLFC